MGTPPSALPTTGTHRVPSWTISIQEILNHVLGDLDLFINQLKTALGSANADGKKKKKKKDKGGEGGNTPLVRGWGGHPGASAPVSAPPALPPKGDYVDFFQKVKYALNLMVSPLGLEVTPMARGHPWHVPARSAAGLGAAWGWGGLWGHGGAARGPLFPSPHRTGPTSTCVNRPPRSCCSSSSPPSPL